MTTQKFFYLILAAIVVIVATLATEILGGPEWEWLAEILWGVGALCVLIVAAVPFGVLILAVKEVRKRNRMAIPEFQERIWWDKKCAIDGNLPHHSGNR